MADNFIEKNKKSKPLAKMTRKERRKKFNKWLDMDFLHKQTGKSKPSGGFGERQKIICDFCGISGGKFSGKFEEKIGKTIWRCPQCSGKSVEELQKEKEQVKDGVSVDIKKEGVAIKQVHITTKEKNNGRR